MKNSRGETASDRANEGTEMGSLLPPPSSHIRSHLSLDAKEKYRLLPSSEFFPFSRLSSLPQLGQLNMQCG